MAQVDWPDHWHLLESKTWIKWTPETVHTLVGQVLAPALPGSDQRRMITWSFPPTARTPDPADCIARPLAHKTQRGVGFPHRWQKVRQAIESYRSGTAGQEQNCGEHHGTGRGL